MLNLSTHQNWPHAEPPKKPQGTVSQELTSAGNDGLEERQVQPLPEITPKTEERLRKAMYDVISGLPDGERATTELLGGETRRSKGTEM